MRKATAMVVAAGLAMSGTVAWGSSDVRGKVSEFSSPSGATERCVALAHMPGARYTEADVAKEAEFCSIDFHGKTHGLCPKVFSTSPGTLVYSLDGGPYAGNPIFKLLRIRRYVVWDIVYCYPVARRNRVRH